MTDTAVTMHLVAHDMLSSVMHQIKLHTSVLVKAEYGCSLALLDASTSAPGSSSVTTKPRYGRSLAVHAPSYQAYHTAFKYHKIARFLYFGKLSINFHCHGRCVQLSMVLPAVGSLACAIKLFPMCSDLTGLLWSSVLTTLQAASHFSLSEAY